MTIFVNFDLPCTQILDHLGTRPEFLTMRNVISAKNWYRNFQNLEKSDFFVENFFIDYICQFRPPCSRFWALLGARYEYLTMRKLISAQNWYRNIQNLEKSDFFVEKIFFSSIFVDFDPIWVIFKVKYKLGYHVRSFLVILGS